jgi:hypothetical protein
MTYTAKADVYSENRSKHSTQSEHHVQFLNVKPLKDKVKCTLVQALRLCTGRTAHRGSRDIALL